MKSFAIFSALVALCWLCPGCTKEGSTGATGAQGPAGPVGPAGADGTVIYSGATTPSDTAGAVGDYFLDLSTDVLYGPKSSSGWGGGISLVGATGATGTTGATGAAGATGAQGATGQRGATGAAGATGATGATGAMGAAGSQIYSGAGTPSASLGNVGDYYLDDTSYVLYGPKTTKGWGTGIVLKGATGTANVIYSAWNYVSDVRDTVLDGSNLVIANLPASSLSSAIVSEGTILLYFTFDGGATVWPLPYTSYAGGIGNTISFIPYPGQILITRFAFDNSASVTIGLNNEYRFILIPGGVSVPNSLDYHTVTQYYHLPEN